MIKAGEFSCLRERGDVVMFVGWNSTVVTLFIGTFFVLLPLEFAFAMATYAARRGSVFLIYERKIRQDKRVFGPLTMGNIASFLFRTLWLIAWYFIVRALPAFVGREIFVIALGLLGFAGGLVAASYVNWTIRKRTLP